MSERVEERVAQNPLLESEASYLRGKVRLGEVSQEIERVREFERARGASEEPVERVVESLELLRIELQNEVSQFEDAARGELPPLQHFGQLGEHLRLMRVSRGYTTDDVARLLHADPQEIARQDARRFRGISLDQALILAHGLGYDLTGRVTQIKLNPEDAGDQYLLSRQPKPLLNYSPEG